MAKGRSSRWFYVVFYILAVVVSLYLANIWKQGLLRAYEQKADRLQGVQDNTVEDAPSASELQNNIDSHLKSDTQK